MLKRGSYCIATVLVDLGTERDWKETSCRMPINMGFFENLEVNIKPRAPKTSTPGLGCAKQTGAGTSESGTANHTFALSPCQTLPRKQINQLTENPGDRQYDETKCTEMSFLESVMNQFRQPYANLGPGLSIPKQDVLKTKVERV